MERQMDKQLFVQLVAAALRDEFEATIVTDGDQVTVVFCDGTRYLLKASDIA